MSRNPAQQPSRMRRVLAALSRANDALYRYHYGVGIHTIRFARCVWRRFYRLTAPVRRLFHQIFQAVAAAPLRRAKERLRCMGQSFANARTALAATAKRRPLLLIPHVFRLLFSGLKHYRSELGTLWRLMGPVGACLLLVATISMWKNTTFCLSLTYQGEELGYIDNEIVYDAAAVLAKGRVINEDDSFHVDAVPTLAITVQREKPTLTDAQLCDAILRTAGDAISEGAGLYVDGKFIGAMDSADGLNSLLQGIKEKYYDKKNKDQRAEFVQDVQVVEGLYPTTTVTGASSINKTLTAEAVVKKTYTVQTGDTLSKIAVKNDMTTAQLRKMNPAYAKTDMVRIGDVLTIQSPQPFLRVKMIETIRYTETIDYQTETVYDDSKYVTYSAVVKQGKEGKQDVVAEVTYMDGVETGRKVISTKVTKQPVTKVVKRGTKKVISSSGSAIQQGDGVTTGSMLWPVPICHNMSRGYFRGHYAIDIANGPVTVRGKPAVAADGGKVIYATTGWNGGYGNVVKIQHANGLITVYAHLQSIKVVKGQSVTRGQTIGLVGNSGNSYGPHLHFEVIKNGVKVNPLNYVKP